MPATSKSLRITLLGTARVWKRESEVLLGPPKQRAVFSVLAHRAGEVIGVEQIIDAVWGGEIPQTAANGVHTYVGGLRRLLEPERDRRESGGLIVSGGGGYALRTEPESVDSILFTRYLAQARQHRTEGRVEEALQAFDSALALWRGDAYTGVPGPFAAMERTRLHDLRFTAVEEWAADMLDTGRHSEVLSTLSRAVAEEPLREKLRCQLMLALYRCGRQAHALELYTETRQLLRRELGIEPGAELGHLHQRILAGHPDLAAPERTVPAANVWTYAGEAALATPRPAQLPPGPSGFVGRAGELQALNRALDGTPARTGATTPVAVIDGPAGVGKTAFALELAHELSAQYPDGQLYVQLRGSAGTEAALSAFEALALLLGSLGMDCGRVPSDLAGRVAVYRSLLHGKRMLLVLDDAVDVDQLEPLIPRGPCCVLITSRKRQTELAVRYGVHRVQLGSLAVREALELLDCLAPGRLENCHEVAVGLVRLCSGMPLALRTLAEALAAVPDTPPERFVAPGGTDTGGLERLAAEDGLLAGLHAVFSMSYEALPPEGARLFRQLSLYEDEVVNEWMAAQLAGVDIASARRQLELLAERHLLEAVGARHYRLHRLVAYIAADCVEGQVTPARGTMRVG